MKDNICRRYEDAVIREPNTQNTKILKRPHVTYGIQDFKLLLCLKNINLPKKKIFRFIHENKRLIVVFTCSILYFSKRSGVKLGFKVTRAQLLLLHAISTTDWTFFLKEKGYCVSPVKRSPAPGV